MQRAKDGIGLAVIADRRIAAVERSPPPRAPEVLIARVDAPSRGHIDVGACVVEGAAGSKKVGTAIDAIGEDSVGSIEAVPSRRRDDEYDYIRWCFADLAIAEAFVAQAF